MDFHLDSKELMIHSADHDEPSKQGKSSDSSPVTAHGVSFKIRLNKTSTQVL